MKSYHQRGGFKFGKNPATGSNYTPNEAFRTFIGNLTNASTLTDSSISCLTVRLTANFTDIANAPYLHTRRGYFATPMNQILMKFMIRDDSVDKVYMHSIPNVRYEDPSAPGPAKEFEIATLPTIRKEVSTQLDIYDKSIKSTINALDAFVPAVIGFFAKPNSELLTQILSLLNRVYQDRTDKSGDFTRLSNLLSYPVTNPALQFSIIVMEFLPDFVTFNSAIQGQHPPTVHIYNSYAIHEFVKLRNMGYLHADSHGENVMFNTESLYFTNDPLDSFNKGRAMIIDFGRIINTNNLPPAYSFIRSILARAERFQEPTRTIFIYSEFSEYGNFGSAFSFMIGTLRKFPNDRWSRRGDPAVMGEYERTYTEIFNKRTIVSETYLSEISHEVPIINSFNFTKIVEQPPVLPGTVQEPVSYADVTAIRTAAHTAVPVPAPTAPPISSDKVTSPYRSHSGKVTSPYIPQSEAHARRSRAIYTIPESLPPPQLQPQTASRQAYEFIGEEPVMNVALSRSPPVLSGEPSAKRKRQLGGRVNILSRPNASSIQAHMTMHMPLEKSYNKRSTINLPATMAQIDAQAINTFNLLDDFKTPITIKDVLMDEAYEDEYSASSGGRRRYKSRKAKRSRKSRTYNKTRRLYRRSTRK